MKKTRQKPSITILRNLFIWFLILTSISEAKAQSIEVFGLSYHITSKEDLTCELTAPRTAIAYEGKIEIPAKVLYNGKSYTINRIADKAFKNATNLTCVKLSKNITSIGQWAFSGCTSIQQINFPDSIVSIEDFAFFCCDQLQQVTLPPTLIHIGKNAFSNCSALKNAYMPDSLSRISDRCFSGCSALDTVILPAALSSIGHSAFQNCISLKSIDIPLSTDSISVAAFMGCTALDSISLPDSLTHLEQEAFQGCSSLSYIKLPSELQTIPNYAFNGCLRLKEITLPANLSTIGRDVFGDCPSLTSIQTDQENSFFQSTQGVLFDASGTKLIRVPEGQSGEYIIPNGTEIILQEAFANCNQIKAITIPSTVTTIEEEAFIGCESLSSVTTLSTTPLQISNNTFCIYQTLNVPTFCCDAYETAPYWNYFNIVEKDFIPEPEPELEPEPEPIFGPCEAPTITYSYGHLYFNSRTEGSVCHHHIETFDQGDRQENEYQLLSTYKISAYATAEGYETSDTTYAYLFFQLQLIGEEETDNLTTIPATGNIITTSPSCVTVSGIEENLSVVVRSLDGRILGHATPYFGTATVTGNFTPGTIVIVNIGNKSTKVPISSFR